MSRSTAVVEHARDERSLAPTTVDVRAREDVPRLGLPLLDKCAATAFTGPDAPDVEELTRSTAAALADPDPDAARAVRRRTIARLTAIEKTTLTTVVAMLGEHVRAGLPDQHALRVARVLDALATSACRRLTMLLGASEQRATAIAIENALVRVEAAE